MITVDPITIEIGDESAESSLIGDLRSLQTQPITKSIDKDDDPIILKNKKPKSQKKKKKKSKLSIISTDLDLFTSDEEIDEDQKTRELIDIASFLDTMDERETNESDEIVNKQKKGYKKLKNGENSFKKEFAEEITLLYSLLDETTQYSKELEKDLKGLRTSKVRGVSKYTNDLASLVLNAKQTKLNILKEIASVKKNIADLGIKDKKDDSDKNAISSEALASQYFKNILTHGRTDFINRMSSEPDDIDISELNNSGFSDKEELEYNRILEERLSSTDNPFRSPDGSKYIEYENRDVEIRVNRCIDTGEWEFIAVDKLGTRIDDYPLPSKRSAGRMKFSEDSTYATDSLGRMYRINEYYLPEYNE